MCDTYWNVSSLLGLRTPNSDFGPLMNMVNVKTNDSNVSPYSWYMESVPSLFPAELLSSMQATRTERLQL